MSREVMYLDPNTLTIVGLDVHDDSSPLKDDRSGWDVDESMVKNIMVYGIQLPVIVRSEAGKTYVVDGRQRVKAAREAARRQDEAGEHTTKVPCIEVKADDGRVSGIMVSTNEIRKDDEILGKARKASRLMDLVGNIEEVAIAFGRSTKTIENWLKLIQADPKVHTAIENGTISPAVGIELAGKSRQAQLEALAQLETAPGAASSSRKPKAAAAPEEDDSKKEHPGIKKGWVRRAMKTEAAKALPPAQKSVLNWIIDGRAPANSWMSFFEDAVQVEIAEKAQRKAEKGSTPIPDSDADAGAEAPAE
jgi:ParB family chromosome partitioning protein